MLGLVGGGFWFYRRLFPPDPVLIRRTLLEATAAASFDADQGGLNQLAALNRLPGYFTPDVAVVVDASGGHQQTISGRDQLREVLAAVRTTMTSLRVGLSHIHIVVEEAGELATAQFMATAETPGEDEIVQECIAVMKKVDGVWKIHRIEPVPSLEL